MERWLKFKMTEINNNLNNIQGITPEIVKAIELYCEGISKMFDNNATVKSNLLKIFSFNIFIIKAMFQRSFLCFCII